MATPIYCKSGAGALPMQNRTWASGDKMVPDFADATSNVANGQRAVWECTTIGTSNGTPTWPAGNPTYDTTTVTQNGVVWTARKPGFSSGTTANWAFATIYLKYACAAASTVDDVIYVSNNHAESVAASYTAAIGNGGGTVICVDDGAAPPTTLATTATVTTTGTSPLQVTGVNGNSYIYGVNFVAGSGASGGSCNLTVGSGINETLEKCSFHTATTGAAQIVCASARLINCDFKFGAAGHALGPSARCVWTGGALLSGGTSPTNLMNVTAGSGFWPVSNLLFENIDLTNASAGINICGAAAGGGGAVLRNCKMPTSWSGVPATSAGLGAFVTLMNGDNSGTNYIINQVSQFATLMSQTTIVRTGGATNGTTAMSWKIVTTASALYPNKWASTPEIVKWNDTTGSAITVTVEIVSNATLTDAQCWLEVNYLSASGNPLGALSTSRCAILATPTNITSSAASWASSPGTAQKVAVTFTPQLKGYVHAVVKVAKASQALYVDPLLTLS